MPDLIVDGIPIIAIVFGLVEFSKRFGLDGNYLTLLSMVLGVLFGISHQIAKLYPAWNVWYTIIIYGLAFGLSASGLYDFSKKFQAVKA